VDLPWLYTRVLGGRDLKWYIGGEGGGERLKVTIFLTFFSRVFNQECI
jgi:hypothetical protein